ncbi:MAG TPA: MlaD family protein [Gemmatimonadaceae bacterium]|nr:MlaD family protein [Gemmatimonadaceae bacterium]
MRKRPDFIVGLTVLLTAVALVSALVWVRQTDVSNRRQRVVARFRDVGNARVGNAAMIRGVRSGRIDRIELADDGAVLVRLSLERGTTLPRDPVVLLNESSLFGEWQATITERAALPHDEAVQRQLDAVSGDGMIPGATLPDIAKLTAVAGQIAGDVAAVAGRVGVAFDDAAAKELRASIQNFAVLSSTLARTVRDHENDLDTLSSKLQNAVRSLDRTAQTTLEIANRVDSSMTGGELQQLITDLGAAAADLRKTTSTLNGMANNLAATQARLDNFLANGDSVFKKINTGRGTIGMLVNDSSLYVGSDSLVTALRALVIDVRANPKKFFNLSVF